MASRLMPQVDVRIELFPFWKHSSADVIHLEDKHRPIFVPSGNDSAFVLNEAVMVIKSDLHALVNYLSNRHQILGDHWHIQDIPHLWPTWLRGTSPMCLMGWEVSSSVSMTLGCSYFSIVQNHSLWFVIWFDVLESTYNTSFGFKFPASIRLALCFITNVGPVSVWREPSV